jgi:4-hydroxythreonine-4-phosphate dehydrogenase
MSHDRLPRIALSAGEPAGIGPDIIASVATRRIPARLACIIDPDIIAERAATLGIVLDIVECSSLTAIPAHRPGILTVLPINAGATVTPGRPDTGNARYVLECLDTAVAAARRGDIDAIVTGPVHKGIINDAGFAFTGHTEYLAGHFDPRPIPVMMLVSGGLRVALATTHMALQRVPGALTPDRITYAIDVVAAALKCHFGIRHPRIGVCGLNPHAGENGHFGLEDRDIIAPAIAAAQKPEVTVVGPMPADTAFSPEIRASIDAYLTMYHDQGLPVIKALGFGDIVNITLGLPILRTSVDHGTALELAGSGNARADSLVAAVTMAIALTTRTMQ